MKPFRSFLAVLLTVILSSSSFLAALAEEVEMKVLSMLAFQGLSGYIEVTVAGSGLRADALTLSLEGCSSFLLNPEFSADFQLAYSCEMKPEVVSGKYPVVLKNTSSQAVLFEQLVSYTAPASVLAEKIPSGKAENSELSETTVGNSIEGEKAPVSEGGVKDPVNREKKAKKEQPKLKAEIIEPVVSTQPFVQLPELQQQSIVKKQPTVQTPLFKEPSSQKQPKSPVPTQPIPQKQTLLPDNLPGATLAFQTTSALTLQKALAMRRIPSKEESFDRLMKFAFPSSSSSQPKIVLALAPAVPALPLLGEGVATGVTLLGKGIVALLSSVYVALSLLLTGDEAIPQEKSESTTAEPGGPKCGAPGMGGTSIKRDIHFPKDQKLGYSKQLQEKFNHAESFGVKGNWNLTNAKKFEDAIMKHIQDPATQIIEGSFRNYGQGFTHYFNEMTKNVVIKDPQGNFVSGYQLELEQIQKLKETCHIGINP